MIITIETDDFPIDARFSVNGKAFKVIADNWEFLPEEITLRNIVGIGIARMNEAVEAVIAKHESEIKEKAIEKHEIDVALKRSAQEMDLIRRRNFECLMQDDRLLLKGGYLGLSGQQAQGLHNKSLSSLMSSLDCARSTAYPPLLYK